MFGPPQIRILKPNPTPSVMVLGGGALGLMRSGGAGLRNGISAPIKGASGSSLALSTLQGQRAGALGELGHPLLDAESAGILVSDSPASKTVINKRLLVISHPVLVLFVTAA